MFREMGHILDSEIKPLVFQLSDGGDIDDIDHELVWKKERRLQAIKASLKEKNRYFLEWRFLTL